MSKTTKEIIFWLSSFGAATGALLQFLLLYPGDLVSQTVLLVVGAASVFLSALVAFATRQQG